MGNVKDKAAQSLMIWEGKTKKTLQESRRLAREAARAAERVIDRAQGLAGQPAWQGETRGVGPGLPWTPLDAPAHGPHRESHVHAAVRTVLDAAMEDPAGNDEAIRALSRALAKATKL